MLNNNISERAEECPKFVLGILIISYLIYKKNFLKKIL